MSKDYSAGKYAWGDAGNLESTLVAFERRVLDPLVMSYMKGYTINVGCGPDKRGNVRLDVEPTEATTIVGDACKLPFPDNHFDTVLLIGVLHHISNYTDAISEACRVTRGIIIGREPNILNPHLCTIRHFLGMPGECPIYVPKAKRTFESNGMALVIEEWSYGLKLLGMVTKQHDFLLKFDVAIPNKLRAFWSYVYVKRQL